MKQHATARPIVAMALALMMSAAVADAQTKIKSGFNLFSAEQDVEIGRQSVGEVERQMPLLNDSQVDAYVNNIGRKLAANAGGPKFPYTFKVINAADINAFALPGGPIYINRGILDNARNEGEVAGVVAHEIAHVALRHGTHQASKAYGAQAGLSILGGLLGGKMGGNTAQILNTVGGVGLNVLFLRFSRDMETQADIRGAQILAASGYTPADMVSFFQTLSKADGSKKTTFLSDHPAPPDRISRIQKEAQILNVPATPTTNVGQLNDIKDRMRSSYGAAPTAAQIARSGPSAGGDRGNRGNRGGQPSQNSGAIRVEPPSNSMSTFTSPSRVFRVNYPSNWRVYQEGNSGVTFAPEGGIGNAGGRTEVVYGAMVNHYDPFGSQPSSSRRLRGSSNSGGVYGQEITLEQASTDLINQVRQGSPHLKAISGSTQRFSISGGAAISVAMRGVNPNTRLDERVTVVTRQLHDDHLIYLLFITPENDSRNYGPVLQAMVNSLQVDDDHPH